MPNDPQYLYWDADVILNYLNQNPVYHNVLSKILYDVGQSGGKQKIITSVLSQSEVFYLKNGNLPNFTQASMDKIDLFFMDSSVIELVSISDYVIRIVRDLKLEMKKNGKSIKTPDAIHLATAKYIQASVFHTYNAKHFVQVSKLNLIAFPIRQPDLAQIPLLPIPPPTP